MLIVEVSYCLLKWIFKETLFLKIYKCELQLVNSCWEHYVAEIWKYRKNKWNFNIVCSKVSYDFSKFNCFFLQFDIFTTKNFQYNNFSTNWKVSLIKKKNVPESNKVHCCTVKEKFLWFKEIFDCFFFFELKK